MLCLSQAFFIIQYIDHGTDGGHYEINHDSDMTQRKLLGWSIFLAWFNLTNFLGRFDICGKHIYRSWHVMKNVVMSVVVYLPIMIAFSMAFHCFLIFNGVFEGPVASLFKVLTMILGEFDFEDNFLYDKVVETKGSFGSVQFLFVVIFVFGNVHPPFFF